MRNIKEYPVTKDELLIYLNSLEESIDKEYDSNLICGDMRLLYLDELRKIINETNYTFKLD